MLKIFPFAAELAEHISRRFPRRLDHIITLIFISELRFDVIQMRGHLGESGLKPRHARRVVLEKSALPNIAGRGIIEQRLIERCRHKDSRGSPT
jgi:hypothetical protein